VEGSRRGCVIALRDFIAEAGFTVSAMADAETPRPMISTRRETLLVYVVLMLLAVPVWWRTTEVYRASLPFHMLPADLLDVAAKEELPVLQVHVVVHDQVSLGDASLAEETARWLEEGTAQYARAEQEGVRIKFSAARLGASIPEDLEGDEALDSWLADHCPSSAADGGDGAETFAVFLLPERAGGAGGAAIAVRGDGAHVLTMGVGMHGWLAVPATVAGSTDALRAWLDWLPLAVASVVCGERAEVACPARASSVHPARAYRTERSALPFLLWGAREQTASALVAGEAAGARVAGQNRRAKRAHVAPPAPPRPAPPRPAPCARPRGRRGRAQGPMLTAGRGADSRGGGRARGGERAVAAAGSQPARW